MSEKPSTPFFVSPTLLCRCGQVPQYVGHSTRIDGEDADAEVQCVNWKCGAYKITFRIKLQWAEGRVIHANL